MQAQVAHVVRAVVAGSHVIEEIGLNRPVPALSLTFRECIERAMDYAWGGARYNTGNGIILIGVADLVNSIAAVKKLVYEDKMVSMAALLEALDNDFEGCPDVRSLCLKALKYGNGEDEADLIAGVPAPGNDGDPRAGSLYAGP